MDIERWVGIDFDGTLCAHNGLPVMAMVRRVQFLLAHGYKVQIVTARVAPPMNRGDLLRTRKYIEDWCLEYIGAILPITNEKDYAMLELWDDRAVQVITDTGELVDKTGYLYYRLLGGSGMEDRAALVKAHADVLRVVISANPQHAEALRHWVDTKQLLPVALEAAEIVLGELDAEVEAAGTDKEKHTGMAGNA